MGLAKVVRLVVEPRNACNLAFPTDGIIDQVVQGRLGYLVAAYDYTERDSWADTQASLASVSPALCVPDSTEITEELGQSCLLSIRAVPQRATLDQALLARSNAYWDKYAYSIGSKSELLDYVTTNYGEQVDSQLGLLYMLQATLSNKVGLIEQKWLDSGWDDVLMTSSNQVSGTTTTTTTPAAMETTTAGYQTVAKGHVPAPGEGETDNTVTIPLVTSTSVAQGDSAAVTSFDQTFTATGVDFHTPQLDTRADGYRAQISLMNQILQALQPQAKFDNLAAYLLNELSLIDLSVKRLQLAYADSFLMSPISGTVTHVAKNVGDTVRAGEPVVRVENNRELLLVGTIAYRGTIVVGPVGANGPTGGTKVTLEAPLFGTTAVARVSGDVWAARCNGSQDDWWDVVIAVRNQEAGAIRPPLHYTFSGEACAHDGTHLEVL